MKRGIIAVLLTIFAMSIVGMAQAETITSGGTKGNYFKVAHKMNQMAGNVFNVVPSKGSIENLDRLMSNEAQIAIVQMDALAWYISEKPEAESMISIVGPLYEECVYIAVNANGKIKDEDDLQSEGVKIAVGEKGAGSTISWDYMRKLEKGYKKAETQYTGGLQTVGKLAAGKGEKDVQAMLFTMKPSVDNKVISTIANNKNLKFIAVDDSDLNDKLPTTGEPVYHFRSVPYAKGVFGEKKIDTICFDAVIVTRSDLNPDYQESLADMVLNYASSLQ